MRNTKDQGQGSFWPVPGPSPPLPPSSTLSSLPPPGSTSTPQQTSLALNPILLGHPLAGESRNKAHDEVRHKVENDMTCLPPSPSDVNEEWTEERGPWAPGRTEIEGPGLPWRGQHV